MGIIKNIVNKLKKPKKTDNQYSAPIGPNKPSASNPTTQLPGPNNPIPTPTQYSAPIGPTKTTSSGGGGARGSAGGGSSSPIAQQQTAISNAQAVTTPTPQPSITTENQGRLIDVQRAIIEKRGSVTQDKRRYIGGAVVPLTGQTAQKMQEENLAEARRQNPNQKIKRGQASGVYEVRTYETTQEVQSPPDTTTSPKIGILTKVGTVSKDFFFGETGKKFVGVGIPFTPAFVSASKIKEFIKDNSNKIVSTTILNPTLPFYPKPLSTSENKIKAFGLRVGAVLIPETPAEVLVTAGVGGIYPKIPKVARIVISTGTTAIGTAGVLNPKFTPEERTASGIVATAGILGTVYEVYPYLPKTGGILAETTTRSSQSASQKYLTKISKVQETFTRKGQDVFLAERSSKTGRFAKWETLPANVEAIRKVSLPTGKVTDIAIIQAGKGKIYDTTAFVEINPSSKLPFLSSTLSSEQVALVVGKGISKNSLNREINLYHGTALDNVKPILKGGFNKGSYFGTKNVAYDYVGEGEIEGALLKVSLKETEFNLLKRIGSQKWKSNKIISPDKIKVIGIFEGDYPKTPTFNFIKTLVVKDISMKNIKISTLSENSPLKVGAFYKAFKNQKVAGFEEKPYSKQLLGTAQRNLPRNLEIKEKPFYASPEEPNLNVPLLRVSRLGMEGLAESPKYADSTFSIIPNRPQAWVIEGGKGWKPSTTSELEVLRESGMLVGKDIGNTRINNQVVELVYGKIVTGKISESTLKDFPITYTSEKTYGKTSKFGKVSTIKVTSLEPQIKSATISIKTITINSKAINFSPKFSTKTTPSKTKGYGKSSSSPPSIYPTNYVTPRIITRQPSYSTTRTSPRAGITTLTSLQRRTNTPRITITTKTTTNKTKLFRGTLKMPKTSSSLRLEVKQKGKWITRGISSDVNKLTMKGIDITGRTINRSFRIKGLTASIPKGYRYSRKKGQGDVFVELAKTSISQSAERRALRGLKI